MIIDFYQLQIYSMIVENRSRSYETKWYMVQGSILCYSEIKQKSKIAMRV